MYIPSIQIDLLMTSRQHSMQHITENVPKTLAGTRCELPHELRAKGWKNVEKYWSHKHETRHLRAGGHSGHMEYHE